MAKPKVMRKTINFTDEYKDEFKHACKQSNFSQYVCELIKNDMQNNISDSSLNEKIKKIVDEMLNSKNIVINAHADNEFIEDELVEDSLNGIKKDINDLLDM